MSKIHIWHRPNRYKCGRVPVQLDWKGPHVNQVDAGDATCLDCLRSVQSFGLWEMEQTSLAVRAATDQIGRLTRAKARKRTPKEDSK